MSCLGLLTDHVFLGNIPYVAHEVQYDIIICCAFVESKEHTKQGGDPAVESVMGYKAT